MLQLDAHFGYSQTQPFNHIKFTLKGFTRKKAVQILKSAFCRVRFINGGEVKLIRSC